MKKMITIVITICQFIFLTAESQENKSEYIKKRQQFCSATITLMDNSIETFALHGFAGDSIVVFPISNTNTHLQILPDLEKRIAASNIKNVKIRVKKIKNSPELYSGNRQSRLKADSVSVSEIQGNTAIDGVGKTFLNVASYSTEAVVVTVVFLPVIIPIAILTAKEKTYHINGQAKKLTRMERRLIKK